MIQLQSYTTIEQSKKLAEILPIESADMCYPLPCEDGDKPLLEQGGFGSMPCWSLAALLDVLPKIYGLKPIIDLEEVSIYYTGHTDAFADNLLDACYKMIVKLYEQNLI